MDFAYGYGLQTVTDPDKELDPDKAVRKMVNYILNGVAPVDKAPEVPAEYWEKLKVLAHRRITLAGYRMADLVIAAADSIASERGLTGKAIDTVG